MSIWNDTINKILTAGTRITHGFAVMCGRPLDSRTVVEDYTVLSAMPSTIRYPGLMVYVEESATVNTVVYPAGMYLCGADLQFNRVLLLTEAQFNTQVLATNLLPSAQAGQGTLKYLGTTATTEASLATLNNYVQATSRHLGSAANNGYPNTTALRSLLLDKAPASLTTDVEDLTERVDAITLSKLEADQYDRILRSANGIVTATSPAGLLTFVTSGDVTRYGILLPRPIDDYARMEMVIGSSTTSSEQLTQTYTYPNDRYAYLANTRSSNAYQHFGYKVVFKHDMADGYMRSISFSIEEVGGATYPTSKGGNNSKYAGMTVLIYETTSAQGASLSNDATIVELRGYHRMNPVTQVVGIDHRSTAYTVHHGYATFTPTADMLAGLASQLALP